MSGAAIIFENISKQYRLGQIGTGTLSHDLNRWWHKVRGREDPYLKIGTENDRSSKADSDYVWALHNIDLEVEQGEVLGIIGKNGAGKSTLLKILSKVTKPTTGIIKAKGRIASLLEIGTGFHPEMTGRENVFMNGSIMGMTRVEIRQKFDEIVDFAGVERYIDTPVKRYSSGMMVRLGFAIAAHLEPEILVVDEVLAVGDAEFQKKAIGKMQEVSRNDGRTVLFVSHNLEAIKTLCSRALTIQNGKIINCGDVFKIVSHYLVTNRPNDNFHFPKTNEVAVNKVYIEYNSKRSLTNLDDIFITVDYTIYNYANELRMVLTFKSLDQIIFQTSDFHLIKQRHNNGRYLTRIRIPKKLLGRELYSLFIRFDIPHRLKITADEMCLNFKLDKIEFNQMGYQASGEPKGLLHPEIQLELIKL